MFARPGGRVEAANRRSWMPGTANGTLPTFTVNLLVATCHARRFYTRIFAATFTSRS